MQPSHMIRPYRTHLSTSISPSEGRDVCKPFAPAIINTFTHVFLNLRKM